MCQADFHVLDSLSLLDILQDSNKAKNWVVKYLIKDLQIMISNLLSIEPGHGLL